MNLLTLKEFAKHKDGTYAALNLSKASQHQLDEFTDNLKLQNKIDPSTYHITVAMSDAPVPQAENLKPSLPMQGHATGWEIFNTKTGTRALVLKVSSPSATRLHNKLKQMGATSSYPTYKPHVSIVFDYHGDIKDLPIPKFPLVFDDFIVKANDKSYVPPSK
jgi:hypothetical protein